MADSSYTQSNFLGGEFSPAAQGRIDIPDYRTAVGTSLNGMPIEEGSWTRRSGTWEQGLTYLGQNGQITEFWLPNHVAAIIELTPGQLRVWLPGQLLTPTQYGYSSQASFACAQITTPDQAQAIRTVQIEDTIFLLQSHKQPLALVCTNYAAVAPGTAPNFVLENDAGFDSADGPYNDPLPGLSQTDNSLGAVDGNSFTPVFTISDAAYTFTAADAGRLMRLWSQPPAWDGAHLYATGDHVSFQGTYWRCVHGTSSTGIPPGTSTAQTLTGTPVPTQIWVLAPQAGLWVYGYITTFTNGTTVTITLFGAHSVPTTQNGLVIDTWRLGTYGGTATGGFLPLWPTCGCYHEGRLWLGGAVSGRFDASMSNKLGKGVNNRWAPMFSPTNGGGVVNGDSAISYTVNEGGSNLFLWMLPVQNSLMMGTAAAEWLVQASAANMAMTPLNIQAHVETRYKSQDSEAIRAGQAILFVQSFSRRLIEYVVDVFSQRFVGRHLNKFAKHLTPNGLRKVAYQEELAPVIWGVTGRRNPTANLIKGSGLIGCTYRRMSHFGQEEPVFAGWHQHSLGSGRNILWACLGTDPDGTKDVLMLLTNAADGSVHVEMMRPLFDVSDDLTSAWFLDTAVPGSGLPDAQLQSTGLKIGGMSSWRNGTSVRVFLAGLDCGSYTVASGSVTVPFKSDPDQKLTAAYLASVSATGYDRFGLLTLSTDNGWFLPCVIGYLMTSIVTLLRPQTQEQTRTPTGPGPGKTRRHHQAAVQFANTVTGPSIQIDDSTVHALNFTTEDQITQLDHTTLFSGIHWQTVDAGYNLDGRITITTSSPYPMTIASVTGFLHTQDR